MLYRKALISFAIFLILVLGAWALQQRVNREHIRSGIYGPASNVMTEDPILLDSQAETLPEEWKFGSREYIKVYTPAVNQD
ncbi:hypothetical protein [Peribacillus glennii]|uniref:Uncharacterized protein n=1 Tax=Peribacillus glennii TaxID=2303991 RepID=A0A372LDI4_9BACI|nr:hypothetical protein [Peribacillus glennii]RFU63758.1 hypothetical protein D0466_09820 [Peribacillus glennii]